VQPDTEVHPVLVTFFSHSTQLSVLDALDGSARTWDLRSGREYVKPPKFPRRGGRAAMNPAHTRAVIGDYEGTTRVFETSTGKLLASLPTPHRGSYLVAISPDGTHVLTNDGTTEARLWRVDTGVLVANLRGHEQKIDSMGFSPDGKHIVTASHDGTARVWQTSTGAELRSFDYRAPRLGFAFQTVPARLAESARLAPNTGVWIQGVGRASPAEAAGVRQDDVLVRWDGEAVRAGDLGSKIERLVPGKTVRLEVLRGGVPLTIAVTAKMLATQYVHFAGFDPAGQRITIHLDRDVDIWDIHSGERVAKLAGKELWFSIASAFDATGRRIATSSGTEGITQVWDVESGKSLSVLKHGASVGSLAFSPDGARLAIASAKGWTLWQLNVAQMIAFFVPASGNIQSLQFSPDGTRLVAVDASSILLVSSLLPAGNELVRLARKQVPQPLADDELRRYALGR